MATEKVLLLTIHLPFPINHGASLFNTYKLATGCTNITTCILPVFLKGEDKKVQGCLFWLIPVLPVIIWRS